MTPFPAPPHEPEIEVLRRIASGGLLAIRSVFWLAGAFGVWSGVFGPPDWTTLDWQQPEVFVFACAGAPLVVPSAWWLGRGRWLALGIGLVMVAAPMLHADDHRYGYVLRAFALLTGCLSMVVWRALWRLTRTD